jgi:hypothetical protein
MSSLSCFLFVDMAEMELGSQMLDGAYSLLNTKTVLILTPQSVALRTSRVMVIDKGRCPLVIVGP